MKSLILFIITIIISSCSKHEFIVSDTRGELVHEFNDKFVFGGLAQEKQTDPVALCAGKENITKIETERTFGNGLLSFITFQIYTPMSVRVYCKKDRFNKKELV